MHERIRFVFTSYLGTVRYDITRPFIIYHLVESINELIVDCRITLTIII